MIDESTAVVATEAANDSVGLLGFCILLMMILSSLTDLQPKGTSLGGPRWGGQAFVVVCCLYLLLVETAIFVKCHIDRALSACVVRRNGQKSPDYKAPHQYGHCRALKTPVAGCVFDHAD
jgi:hypothetical protein